MTGNGDTEDYRVRLDIYNGPVDLLLFLVYKNEVDIFNIPIAEILEQYLAYVEIIKDIDLEIAGDFMVLASRLVNIKSKLLMPRPETEPEEEEIIDPRAELVRELLEYKEYKERAYALEQKKLERDKMYERVPIEELARAGTEIEWQEPEDENVSVWNLLHAFHRITKDFMPDRPRRIVYDDTPLRVYVEKLAGRVSIMPGRKMAFSEVFTDVEDRMQVIGMFLALLEAVREGALKASQIQEGGEIYIEFVPESERLPKEPKTPVETSGEDAGEGIKTGNGKNEEDFNRENGQ